MEAPAFDWDTEGFDLSQLNRERFVANNYSGLAKEMATGDGEQLTVLASFMGCPTAIQPRFNAVTQDNYSMIFATDSTDPSEMLKIVKAVVLNDAELSSACSIN